MHEEEPLPDGKVILGAKRVTACQYGCMYHKKESRYRIREYPNDNLVVIYCLECNPPTEVVRFKLAAKEEQDHG